MKKFILTASIVLSLILVGSLAAACAGEQVTKTATFTTTVGGVTKTMTVTTTGTKTTITGDPFSITITVQPTDPGAPPITLTPTFPGVAAPSIPHPFIYEDLDDPLTFGLFTMGGVAVCFVCHGQVENHNQWAFDPNVCLDCHSLMSDPILPYTFDEEWWDLDLD